MKKIVLAPCIRQAARWPSGCESLCAVMALGAAGVWVDPDTFVERDLPRAPLWEQGGVLWGPDPRYVYPGDPRGPTGRGCYAPCICQAMRSALEAAGAADALEPVDETGRTAAELCGSIDAGLPVVFWATRDFRPGPADAERWLLPSGQPFDWDRRAHCLLLVGYDEARYWFNDPRQGGALCAWPKALVEECHRAQGMYAVGLRRVVI